MIIASASYVKYFRDILTHIAQTIDVPVVLIDDNSLLPANIVTDHEEYGAYTLRKKYWYSVASLSPEKHEPNFPQVQYIKKYTILSETLQSDWYLNVKRKLEKQSAGADNQFPGGETSAQKQWKHFLNTTL